MADSRGIYQVLVNEEDFGGKGAAIEVISTAGQKLSLNLYERYIYLILKQAALADAGSAVADAKPKLAPEIKQQLKEDAVALAESDDITSMVNVYRGKNKVTDELKNGGAERIAMGSGAPIMDYVETGYRSFWQVRTDVLQRQDNISDGSQDNPNSGYSRSMFNDGTAASGLTPVGYGSVIFVLLSSILGMLRGLYQIGHKKELKGNAHVAKQAELNEDAVEDLLNVRLKEAMKDNTLSVYPILEPQKLPEGRTTFLDDMIKSVDDFFNVSDSDVAASTVKKWSAKAYRGIHAISALLWDRLSMLSYIFWLVWMPFVMVCGLAAASGPMMPFVLLITLAIGTVFNGLKLAQWYSQKKSDLVATPDETKPEVVALPDSMKAEFDRLAHATKLLLVIDRESERLTDALNLEVGAKPRHAYNSSAQAHLRERLLGSIHARRGRVVIAGFRGFLGGLLTVIFIGWLASSFLGLPLLGFLGVGGIASFIGGTATCGIAGIIAGIYNSISSMSLLRKSQLAYEQDVDTILQAPYRGTNETKAEAFERLYAQVEARKKIIEKYLDDNKAQIIRPANYDELDEASKKLIDDEIAKHKALREYIATIDVFNDRFFEKFDRKEGGFTILKKVLNRMFEFTFATQTGGFVARFSFLKGGFLTGALGFSVLAGMWPFLIVAGALMLLVGTVALIDYQLKVDQEHRMHFANTLDPRLYYMETKVDELFAIQRANNIFKNDASELEVVATPTPVDPSVNVSVSSSNLPEPSVTEARALNVSDRNVPNANDVVDECLQQCRDAKSIPTLKQTGMFAANHKKVQMQQVELAERPVHVDQSTLAAPAA